MKLVCWGLLIMSFMVTPALSQDADPFGEAADDSLLFGEEFDLGGQDFSFDFEDEAATDEAPAGEDDFFDGLEDEEDSIAVQETAPAVDDWGFGDDLSGADSTAADSLLPAYTDHPMDFRKSTNGTFLEGTGYTLSLYSPQVVHEKLDTWYSYLDYSLSIELPWHYQMDPLAVSFLVDISSFNFENSFPAGGSFKGFSFMPSVRAEVMGLEAEAGVGMFYPTWGIMVGMGYSVQFHSLFLSAGYRWNWAYKIEPLGSAWWLEPRVTTGIKLW